jgi:Helix-turn-helix domain
MADQSSPFLTLSQVAARTGRHPELLRQWCAAGRIPCQRLGGSWVLRESDLGLLDRMATRSRRRVRSGTPASGRRRLIAAVFEDADHASQAGAALRERLTLEDASIESAPLGLRSLAGLGLTVVAGHVPEESTLDARRILGSYRGRIVAELDGGATAGSRRSRAERARPTAAG